MTHKADFEEITVRKEPGRLFLAGAPGKYCHMEQLVNLGALPPSGFKVAVFPLKIKGANVAPARVVAIIESIIALIRPYGPDQSA